MAARPISTTKPIWVRMLMSRPCSHTPNSALENRHMGTIRMMASGSDQLSYCAASARNTKITLTG